MLAYIENFRAEHSLLTQFGALLLALVLLVIVLSVLQELWTRQFGALRHIPFPPLPIPFLPFVGHIPLLISEPWRVFYELSKKYGRMYIIRLWTQPLVVVSDPELVKHMFRDKASIYIKDQWSYEYFRDVLGYGLVTSEGETWNIHRAMMMPAFDFKALERLQAIFEKATHRLISNIEVATASKATGGEEKGPFVRSKVYMKALGDGTAMMELSSTFRQVTLEVISEVALNMNAEEAGFFPPLFEEVLDELNQRVFKPWRAFTHGSSHKANVQRLNDFIAQKVAQRRETRKYLKNDLPKESTTTNSSSAATLASPAAAEDSVYGGVTASGEGSGKSMSGKLIFADGSDMLDLLLDSIDAGVTLSDDQLCDQIKTQLLAGHETSSMMLTWATYLLVKHPEALAKAVMEVDTVLGLAEGVHESAAPDATHVAAPSFNSFRKLTYIEYVLKEAMRLYSPVPLLNRQVTQEDTLGDIVLPAKTAVIVSIWSIHMNADIWGPDVDKFRPERFGSEESKRRHPWSYLPFSLGARSCVGQNLAITEAKTVLGSLLRKYSLSLPKGQKEPYTDCYVIPLRPAEPLNVILTPRK